MANEKLTMQALIEHDRVQPKLKASKGPGTSNSSAIKENASLKNGDVVQKRRRNQSTSSDTRSQKSVTVPPARTGINFFRIVAATKAWHRLAKQRAAKRSPKPTPKCENTYRLEPAEGKHFSPQKVEVVMKGVIDNHPGLEQYNSVGSKLLVKDLTERINDRVKDLDFPRYKIVCNVIIMERKDQGANIVSRCIWNHQTDNFASYTYKNAAVIVVAYVHGVYFE